MQVITGSRQQEFATEQSGWAVNAVLAWCAREVPDRDCKLTGRVELSGAKRIMRVDRGRPASCESAYRVTGWRSRCHATDAMMTTLSFAYL